MEDVLGLIFCLILAAAMILIFSPHDKKGEDDE